MDTRRIVKKQNNNLINNNVLYYLYFKLKLNQKNKTTKKNPQIFFRLSISADQPKFYMRRI